MCIKSAHIRLGNYRIEFRRRLLPHLQLQCTKKEVSRDPLKEAARRHAKIHRIRKAEKKVQAGKTLLVREEAK